jgi:hypothetical protein
MCVGQILIACMFGPIMLRAEEPPAPAPSPKKEGPGESGVSITVKDMKVDYLRFRKPRPDGTAEEVASNAPVLLVTIEIANKGDKEVTYKTANGTPGTKDPVAAIRDSTGKVSAVIQFDATLERVEGVKQATIKPGESTTDVLAFLQLPEGVKPATLLLPANCHGNKGTWKISLEGK